MNEFNATGLNDAAEGATNAVPDACGNGGDDDGSEQSAQVRWPAGRRPLPRSTGGELSAVQISNPPSGAVAAIWVTTMAPSSACSTKQ